MNYLLLKIPNIVINKIYIVLINILPAFSFNVSYSIHQKASTQRLFYNNLIFFKGFKRLSALWSWRWGRGGFHLMCGSQHYTARTWQKMIALRNVSAQRPLRILHNISEYSPYHRAPLYFEYWSHFTVKGQYAIKYLQHPIFFWSYFIMTKENLILTVGLLFAWRHCTRVILQIISS